MSTNERLHIRLKRIGDVSLEQNQVKITKAGTEEAEVRVLELDTDSREATISHQAYDPAAPNPNDATIIALDGVYAYSLSRDPNNPATAINLILAATSIKDTVSPAQAVYTRVPDEGTPSHNVSVLFIAADEEDLRKTIISAQQSMGASRELFGADTITPRAVKILKRFEAGREATPSPADEVPRPTAALA